MNLPFKRHWHTLRDLGNNAWDKPGVLSAFFVFLLLGAFVSISLLAFTPTYIHAFLTDDYKHLGFIQPLLERPFTLYRAFDPYFVGWYYRPFQLVYFALFRLLFGTNPTPYYVGILLLHTINILLVYKVARVWGNGRFGSVMAAGLSSVIVTHQQVVGWISAVSILLAAAFSLLSLYFLRVSLNELRKTKFLLLALITAVFAILSREEALALFPLILLVWLFSTRRGPSPAEIGLFSGFGLIVLAYSVVTFLRPTWTPHADAALNLNIGKLASIQNLNQFLFAIFSQYLSIESIKTGVGWVSVILIAGTILLLGLALWRGDRLLRLSILWTGAMLLFLYLVVWLFSGNVAQRYLYLPWLGISLMLGALVEQLHKKLSNRPLVPVVGLLALFAFLFYQAPLSRQHQQQWQQDAEITEANKAGIQKLIPAVHEHTHFFAYDMPPVTDYIQSMAAVWYDENLEGRGGYWKRLLDSGFASPDDYLLNYENGLVYNAMPELQTHKKTYFIWQENPTAEIIHADGTSTPLDSGSYQLNQIVGLLGQKRFGFFMHPPSPEDGWASLTYTTTVPENSALTFGILKDWGGVAGEDGMIFRVNAVAEDGSRHTIYQYFLETETDGWVEPQIPMDDYWQQTILLQFQVHANENLLHDHGYWANPRFVIDSLVWFRNPKS
ncbi:MAG: hypothetical protein KC449_23665 [Anaerolineales bacterium]|nr:hypothetical protein [Anaerolineales bacterium]